MDKQIHVPLPDDLHRRLRERSFFARKPMAVIVRKAIEDLLDDLQRDTDELHAMARAEAQRNPITAEQFEAMVTEAKAVQR